MRYQAPRSAKKYCTAKKMTAPMIGHSKEPMPPTSTMKIMYADH